MNAPLDRQQALQPDAISLDDKYTLDRGRVFLTGTQARRAPPRRTPTVSHFQVLHYTSLVLSVSHW